MKYYSEVLDKVFETEKDLKVAEKAHADEEAKKAEAKELVKKDSEKVQDAFKALNAAKREYNNAIVEARKAYNAAVIAARDTYSKAVEAADSARLAAEEEYDAELSAFREKHPEGYRLTLKDGDNVVTLSRFGDKELNDNLNRTDNYKAFSDAIDKLFNTFLW